MRLLRDQLRAGGALVDVTELVCLLDLVHIDACVVVLRLLVYERLLR